MGLGTWAVIDIETTGIHPATDEIIDLGFLQFEGTKLVRTYSSLVRPENPVSSFITKLTGITNDHLKKAPLWTQVEQDLLTLEAHSLLAHNANFEESFLKRYFDKIPSPNGRESYHDSLFYLALLFPEASTLNLESFINQLGVADKEEHRGLADSRDLLKVLLLATYLTHQDKEFRMKLSEVLMEFPSEFFYRQFFMLKAEELEEIADQIDYPLIEASKRYLIANKVEPLKVDKFDKFSNDFSGQNIQNILRAEKDINEVLPYYKYRAAQESLSLRVGQAFKNGIHALIQAPTGTGKTMGYLLPSFLFSKAFKETCLVATGTKTLQDQALAKDVPQMKRLLNLGPETKVVKLVGSSNHLCELLFREDNNEEPTFITPFGETFTKAYFEMLFFYNSRVPYEKKLTREQIPFILKKLAPELAEKDQNLAVDYRACAGQNCPLVNECSYQQGLREAKEAQLIIGNHALMLNWPRSIPRPQFIVVDEAHRLEHEATKAYSLEVHHKSIESLLKNMPQGMGALIYLLNSMEDEFAVENTIQTLRDQTQFSLKMLRDHYDSLPGVVEAFFKKLPNYSPAYSNELPFPKKSELKDQLAAAILNHIESMNFIFETLYNLYMPFISRWENRDFKNEPQKLKAWAVFETNFGSLEKLHASFKHYIENPADWSTIIKYSESDSYSFESSPIDVGKKIHDELLMMSTSVVFTSATLGNASGDSGVQGVEWMTGYTYLAPEKRFKTGLYLEAVYDYKNNSKVYLCPDTRNISDPLFVPELLAEVNPLITKLGGKTLLLFSSRLRFEQASEIILREFEGKIPVFVQGLGKNVVEEFKKEEGAILIGMESFGEGIDIPGEKLSFIVVDKIPDVRQDLVIQKRRDFFEFKFGNEFNDYFLAHRTRSLHQKFGRLLRSEKDHGAILLVDNRVKKWKGNTLKTFQKLMEPYQIISVPLKDATHQIADYFKV
ncbi:helicase C-terminal domain-containing protein [Peredibacter sp. HCB2-198]|uniref:helicase C-terminal domain-containing protein n=1 Tax=Peredibacter sp. HCB2-198 TaxID=3383025 RepID=UPI0038B53FC3